MVQQPSEVGERRGDVGVIWTECLFLNRKRTFAKRLRFIILALRDAVTTVSELNNPPD